MALASLEEAFGGLEAGQPMAHPRWYEPEQQGLRLAELHRPAGQLTLTIGWVGPAADHGDQPALELLDYALTGGRSSLLVDALVHRDEVLLDVSTSLLPLQQASLFLLEATPAEGVSAEDALAAIEEQLATLRAEPLDPVRIARARRQLELQLYHDLESVEERADMLGSWQLTHGDPAQLFARPEHWAAADGEALQGAASRWLAPEARNVVVLYPTEEGGAE